MVNDDAFLAAIRDDPGDDTSRLVYADWLDEQGRPGGEFLRIDCQIAALGPRKLGKRTRLVARLRAASRDLDEDWMAAVSRVPLDEFLAREREIRSWLRRRVTGPELLARMAEWDRQWPEPVSLWARVLGLFQRPPAADPASQPEGPSVRAMRQWVEANLRPGDELWEYDTGGETWANLCGEMGYAIVRNGKVVEFRMLLMN